MLKEEIGKLNDKLASCLELENSIKVELKSHVGQISEENEKLKIDMPACLKENSELKETISKLIKGKKSLDQALSIPVSFQKEGLGYTLNKKTAPKTKNLISFVKATNNPSTSKSPQNQHPNLSQGPQLSHPLNIKGNPFQGNL